MNGLDLIKGWTSPFNMFSVARAKDVVYNNSWIFPNSLLKSHVPCISMSCHLLLIFVFSVLRKFEELDDLHLNVSEGSNLVIPCQPPYSRPQSKILYKYNHSTIIDKDTGKSYPPDNNTLQ
jgi:hypothetical protein